MINLIMTSTDIDMLFDSSYLTDFIVKDLGLNSGDLVRLLTARPDLVDLIRREIDLLPTEEDGAIVMSDTDD